MKRMILVDGNSLMYRAYYGLQNSMTNSKGMPTNAILAFARMINSLTNSNYDAMLVAFDAGKETFRHSIMDGYKDGRSPMPDEMRVQIAGIKQFLDIKRIKRYEIPLYEADDIIGTMSEIALKEGYHVDIYSSDRDLLQLISENSTVHLNKKGMTELEDYDIKHFEEHYGISVESFVDLKALMGDKSDNIPGVPGIGEKKAIKYLKEYKNIETLLDNTDKIKGSDHDKFVTYHDQALLCKKMATILRDAPIEINLEDTLRKEENKDELIKFYTELEFNSLLRDLSKTETRKVEKLDFEVITSEERLSNVLSDNSYFFAENSDYNYHKNPLLCLGLANSQGLFIITQDLFSTKTLKEYLENENITKFVNDFKRMYVSLKHFNVDLTGVNFDLLLASYIMNPKIVKKDFTVLANNYGINNIPYLEDVYGKGVKRGIPNEDILFNYVALKTNAFKTMHPLILKQLGETEQTQLLLDIELPLSKVLGKMEYNGIKVDVNELERQGSDLKLKIETLEKEIYFIANKEFNISSPKQLAVVLFEDLQIPYPGNSKKGYSTDISILESIRNLNPIVDLVIDYRQYTKLMSTYINGLSQQLFADSKVHTIFEQALTETGRLSSIEPNLQNIPIRTEEGKLIRKMFIPEDGYNSLYSADYSQIELRVLASLANVKHFKEAFNNNEDVHSATARLIFNHNDISDLERRKAKSVNFGIVYGISSFGLANDIGVSAKAAKEFIERYKEINPEIESYMNKILEECKEKGYIKTIKNRRRYIPELNSKNYMEREFGKRMAMNAPIQGSAADIIKIAMIKIDSEIEKANLKSKMLIQVHDELVFEVASGEEEILARIVTENMKNAIEFDVKLDVSDGFGDNWALLK